MTSLQELAEGMIGAPIFTSDGTELGRVKQYRDDAFKVNSKGPDYWLSALQVHTVTPDRVVMRFDRAHLGDHVIGYPLE